MNDNPEYSKYSLNTLYTILRNIDRQKYPERVATLVDTIKTFESKRPAALKILGNQKRLSYSLLIGGKEVNNKISYLINEFSIFDLISKNTDNAKFALLSESERAELSKDPFAFLRKIKWTIKDVLIGLGILSLFYTGLLYRVPEQLGSNHRMLLYYIISIWILNLIYLFYYPCHVCISRGNWPLFPPIAFTTVRTEFLKSIKYYLAAVLTITSVILIISKLIDPGPSPFSLLDLIEQHATESSLFFFLFVLGFTFIPVVEEVFFRGFIYNAFKSRMPIALAAILQSVVFTYGHPYNSLGKIRIFLIGIAFVIIYEKRKNLLSPIFVHGIMNFIVLMIKICFKS
jgi:membrane protease YdiL (CAAX protease family)